LRISLFKTLTYLVTHSSLNFKPSDAYYKPYNLLRFREILPKLHDLRCIRDPNPRGRMVVEAASLGTRDVASPLAGLTPGHMPFR